MNILFVHSGNNHFFQISPFIQTQAESLMSLGHKIDFFPIKGKGIFGYYSNIRLLRKKVSQENYDIIHAHYVLSGWISLLSSKNTPVVQSSCKFAPHTHLTAIGTLQTCQRPSPHDRLRPVFGHLRSDVRFSCDFV